jgi:hypothetical protein
MLGKCSCHGIQNAQSAYAIRYDGCSCTIQTGITIGRIPGIELVAVANPPDGTVDNLVKKIEVIISRNPEQVVNADLPEPLEEITGNGVIFAHNCFFYLTINISIRLV